MNLYVVLLRTAGPNVIQTVREIRVLNGCTLPEAKEIIQKARDGIPAMASPSISMSRAKRFSQKLKAAGNETRILPAKEAEDLMTVAEVCLV